MEDDGDETRLRLLARMREIGREAFVDELTAQMRAVLDREKTEPHGGEE